MNVMSIITLQNYYLSQYIFFENNVWVFGTIYRPLCHMNLLVNLPRHLRPCKVNLVSFVAGPLFKTEIR